MGKILFIAYYFPPIGGSGTQRPTKFVKYLPEFGWQPHIITTDRPYTDQGWDETLLADIPPHTKVWRVPTPLPQPANRLARWVGWRPTSTDSHHSSDPSSSGDAVKLSRPSFIRRIRRALLAPLYLIQEPLIDNALYWSLGIVPLACRIIRQEGIDLVFTTVPPWSSLLTGALLQKLTGRPWIADFRDPWTDNTFIYFPSDSRRRFDQRLERGLITQADAVVSVTEPCLRGLQAKATEQGRRKPFVLIPNGWDRDDFRDLSTAGAEVTLHREDSDTVCLLHPGSTYQGEPEPILRALERLVTDHDVLKRLRFHFIGYMHPEDRIHIAESSYASLFRLDGQRVSHPDAVDLMRKADILLLLRKGPEASSGKIFEYMVSGRPVLAIGAETGVAADFVRRCGIGCAVDPNDVERLAQVLRQIVLDYEGFVTEYYRPNWQQINQYNRRILTKELAEVFARVTARGELP